MHLLVLSAFRLEDAFDTTLVLGGLNAPFGAQCFPTRVHDRGHQQYHVSMHLLVLSAFRPGLRVVAQQPPIRSQCTFWCSVLSDVSSRLPRA